MSRHRMSAQIQRGIFSNRLINELSYEKLRNANQEKRKRIHPIQTKITSKDSFISYFKNIQLESLIKQLKQKGGIQRKKLIQLIDISENILQYESNVLKIASPVILVGDIHGQFFDLLNIFELNGFPTEKKFLFLGDYVDRGLFCIQVITLLLVLKVKYEKNIHLLRGNHQGRIMTMNFNFRLECEKKYGIEIYEKFIDLFCKLPLCAVIDNTYFAVHGGISPQIEDIHQLQKVNRFIEIHNKGVVCDLVWSDPSENNAITWEPNAMRGCSYFYSKNQAKKFLKENKIKMIIRGHEVQIEGYNYQKGNNDQKLTLTIFSAPNYCDTYHNKGAIASISQKKISIHRFNAVVHPFVFSNYMDCLQFTIPSMCQLVGKIFLYLLKSKRNSQKPSIIDDKVLEQLNALQRIQIMTKLFQQKHREFEELLIVEEQKNELPQDLANSYEIAFQIFKQKKKNDQEQKYPDYQTLRKTRQKRKAQILMALSIKKLKNSNQINKKGHQEVFGPKLYMKNNIKRKTFIEDEVA